MSKQMTPCEKLGYKAGDEFEVISHHAFKKGQVVTLHEDDGTECPLFAGDGGGAGVFDGVECSFAMLNKQVRKIANKLNPAKQALADAIHQNGGWLVAGDYNYVASNHRGVVKFFHEKPLRNGVNWVGGSCSLAWVDLHQQLPNWHQCILSRDEYFTAYPEQVKVEVKNETKHKVEVEMKSESEMTIKVSDWHKNGELPPVGEVCEAEYNTTPSVWESVRVVGFDDGECVFRWISGGSAGLIGECSHPKDFRPLRTERERAIDEMIKVINRYDYYGSLNFYVVASDIANAMFDEGFRKEVK